MPYDMSKFADSRWVKSQPNRVYVHGAAEPVLTILDVRGFELHDLFLIGFNDSCGTVVLPTESRAENAAAALEPAYETKVYILGSRDGEDVWATDYTRRALDGTTLSPFLTGLTLKDGRQVIKDGRWVR
ncbi:hypothetical protein [Streptomyces sp. AM 2-1-1]|uniref:hypothetical protein n=1 Tax=Streptomyces sp. AM 2-1-1 TaxID=3028709 RepID=UPI0023B97731|nr:hypothetical protein [Streptomyces sp. AM 2-1-1]WEH43979.1 hypothetical protein PZB77_30930 [Streptomyces sp. AM 2-1-1]